MARTPRGRAPAPWPAWQGVSCPAAPGLALRLHPRGHRLGRWPRRHLEIPFRRRPERRRRLLLIYLGSASRLVLVLLLAEMVIGRHRQRTGHTVVRAMAAPEAIWSYSVRSDGLHRFQLLPFAGVASALCMGWAIRLRVREELGRGQGASAAASLSCRGSDWRAVRAQAVDMALLHKKARIAPGFFVSHGSEVSQTVGRIPLHPRIHIGRGIIGCKLVRRLLMRPGSCVMLGHDLG